MNSFKTLSAFLVKSPVRPDGWLARTIVLVDPLRWLNAIVGGKKKLAYGPVTDQHW